MGTGEGKHSREEYQISFRRANLVNLERKSIDAPQIFGAFFLRIRMRFRKLVCDRNDTRGHFFLAKYFWKTGLSCYFDLRESRRAYCFRWYHDWTITILTEHWDSTTLEKKHLSCSPCDKRYVWTVGRFFAPSWLALRRCRSLSIKFRYQCWPQNLVPRFDHRSEITPHQTPLSLVSPTINRSVRWW